MSYIFLLMEVLLVFLILVIFYRINKKEGLFQYILFMASILCVTMYKFITIMAFQINLGIPIIMGIFLCSNIIIQRFGEDEINKIIKSFICGYVITFVSLNLMGIVLPSEYVREGNVAFNNLFGFDFNIFRVFLGGLISISFMLWYNGNLYYYFRKSHNNILLSNVGSTLVIQFIESVIFVIISYGLSFELLELFGMIVMGYLIKIIIGIIGLVPIYMIVKMKDK